jgi:RNA-directed DNA polymerase
LDVWFEETVKEHCQGAAHLCRYTDDFVCAFELQADAERFYNVPANRLEKFGLEVAADEEEPDPVQSEPLQSKRHLRVSGI